MVCQGFVEVRPGLVELLIADLEVLVGFFHVCSLIFVGTTNNHYDELFLTFNLFFHIDALEERSSDGISQHVDIELVYH